MNGGGCGLECGDGEEGFLDHVHRAGPGRRLYSADLVGTGSDHSDLLPGLVDRLPQRLVLVLIVLISRAVAALLDAFSSGGEPTTTGRDSVSRNPQ